MLCNFVKHSFVLLTTLTVLTVVPNKANSQTPSEKAYCQQSAQQSASFGQNYDLAYSQCLLNFLQRDINNLAPPNLAPPGQQNNDGMALCYECLNYRGNLETQKAFCATYLAQMNYCRR
jgi:hypothetical protein